MLTSREIGCRLSEAESKKKYCDSGVLYAGLDGDSSDVDIRLSEDNHCDPAAYITDPRQSHSSYDDLRNELSYDHTLLRSKRD